MVFPAIGCSVVARLPRVLGASDDLSSAGGRSCVLATRVMTLTHPKKADTGPSAGRLLTQDEDQQVWTLLTATG